MQGIVHDNPITIMPRTPIAPYQVFESDSGTRSVSSSSCGLTASSSLKSTRSIARTTSHATSTMPPMWIRKVLKSIPKAEPIIRLSGSPTSVATPPVSESSAAASRKVSGNAQRLTYENDQWAEDYHRRDVIQKQRETGDQRADQSSKRNSRPLLKSAAQ